VDEGSEVVHWSSYGGQRKLANQNGAHRISGGHTRDLLDVEALAAAEPVQNFFQQANR
jgi:hypothetical protein